MQGICGCLALACCKDHFYLIILLSVRFCFLIADSSIECCEMVQRVDKKFVVCFLLDSLFGISFRSRFVDIFLIHRQKQRECVAWGSYQVVGGK